MAVNNLETKYQIYEFLPLFFYIYSYFGISVEKIPSVYCVLLMNGIISATNNFGQK